MTYEYYKALIGEYINYGRSQERLLGEIGFPADITLDVDGFVKSIAIIAAVADEDVKALVTLSGLKGTAFARKYMLPYRTLQGWVEDKRKPPKYISVLIGYIMITELSNEVVDHADS